MYCGECGAKLDKDATFCGECGAPVKKEKKTAHKLEEEQETENAQARPPRKPMSKKTKIIWILVLIIVVALIAAYQIIGSQFSPKAVAKEYVEALVDNDMDKIYDYLEIDGDTTFVSKEVFKETVVGENETKIKNFTIGDVTYDDNKLSAKVEIHYTEKGSSEEQTDLLYLSKEKEKKYLIFDNPIPLPITSIFIFFLAFLQILSITFLSFFDKLAFSK